jgi:FixJ family two-component response regulator
VPHAAASAPGPAIHTSPRVNSDGPVVFVVDDDEAVRDSLEMLLATSGLRVESHDSAESFLAAYRPGQTGCMILDVKLRDMSGPQLHGELNRLGCNLPVVYLTGYGTIPMSVQAMRNGAADFLTKPVNPHDLLEKIAALVQAQEPLPEWSSTPPDVPTPDACEQLTERERTVLNMVLQGQPNKIIARRLGISYRTVELHRSHILRKTGKHNMIALVHSMVNNHPVSAPEAE